MEHKDLGTNCSVTTTVSDGSTKFALSSPTVQTSNIRPYDVGSSSLGKMDATAVRPCAIIGPDRVVQPNPDDTMYMKKMPGGETWSPADNLYRRPPDYPTKISDYQPSRNISPRQTFQENMQRIMVPPTFSSMKNSDETSFKNIKMNTPQEVKYCDVPYNLNSVNSEHKSVRNVDIPLSNVNPSYTRPVPPPYGWPAGVRPLRPYGAPDFYQYQDFPSCAGPRPMTMIRPHRPLQEDSAQTYPECLYQDANIRFKPYSTGKEKHQQSRYDYISNYPNTFQPPASVPPHKYDLPKTIHGHPYPVYPQAPFKYLDRRIPEAFVDGYHRSQNQQSNFNTIHNHVVPPPYGPIPGNCMQNKVYSDLPSKPMKVNKLQFENNNKVYLNLESRNKNYSVPENLYYADVNHAQAMRGEILLPTHSTLNVHPMSQHTIYRKDNTPLKPYDYNPNYRIFDQSFNVNHTLQRLPLQFSPNTVAISPSDSNTSNDTAHTIGMSLEDCGYVSQSSTASIRSLDSGNISIPHDIYRRPSYNYDIIRNTYHAHGLAQITKNKISPHKKNLNVRQFLQMWNEGDEEASESTKEAVTPIHGNNFSSQNEHNTNQEQLYVLGLYDVPNEELGKYDHIQKISKLPENIKGYNNIEILNQYEELLEAPRGNIYNKSPISRDYSSISKKSLTDKESMMKLPRPVSPLDVEAKISQSVIHKEVGCNFEIKPCSPEMLNVEIATPVQSILGERIIEKVINPTMNKSQNMSRNDNIKPHKSDVVKVTSCKMINNFARNSSNLIKTSNYSMHDLESNAGLCLASLPQLDNDIELNFPEINQQFIKANQIESNITTNLQHLPHLDLEQTHSFQQEIKSDSQQCSKSPQLISTSVVDKEFSKLSKYRKGKKCEPSIPKQDILKSEDTTTVLQRIDSVIIKNPDTLKSQDSDFVKLSSENRHNTEKNSEQFCSLEYETSNQSYDLSTETAIDFSVNRTEDETAVSYLNEIDKKFNHHLPALEEFNECGSISFSSVNSKIQNTEVEFIDTMSMEQDQLQDNGQEKNLTKQCETNKSIKSVLSHNEYDNLMKISVESPKPSSLNGDTNILVVEKLAIHSEATTTEMYNSTDSIKIIDSAIVNTENNTVSCQLNEKKILTNLESTFQPADTINTENTESDSVKEIEKCTNLSNTLKVALDNVECLRNDEKVSLEEFNRNDSDLNVNFENHDIDFVKKENVEKNFDFESDPEIIKTNEKNDISDDITKNENEILVIASKDLIKMREETDFFFKLPVVDQVNGKFVAVEENSDISDYVPSENQNFKFSETNISSASFDDVSGKTEDHNCNIKAEDTSSTTTNSSTVEISTKEFQKGSEITKNICGLDSLSEKVDNSDIVITPKSPLLTITQETKYELSKDNNATLVVNESETLVSAINTSNFSNDISILNNKDIESSINELEEKKQDIKDETQPTAILPRVNCETTETEHNRLSDKVYTDAITDIKEPDVYMNNYTDLDNSAVQLNKCGLEMDNELIRTVKFDLNRSEIETDLVTSKCEEIFETSNIDNAVEPLNSLPSEFEQKQLTENFLNIKKQTHFRKELFSPWIQKLLTLNEGYCRYTNKIKIDDQDCICNKIGEVGSAKNNGEDGHLRNNEMNSRSSDIAEYFSSDIDAITEVKEDLNSEDSSHFVSALPDELQSIKQDNGDPLQENCNFFNNVDKEMNSETEAITARKITKRSLSESALEEYKNKDNAQFLQPCKRMKGNDKYIESHIIPQDICNIIQSTRRNSISTFYNEDVYIVIDNDLILTDEDEESGKICYTEINEFSTNIEPTNSDIDLTLTHSSPADVQNQCESLSSLENIDQKPIEDSWVVDIASMETVFSEDVAENIVIDIQASPKKMNCLELEHVDQEATVFYDSEHINKIKTIYGRTMSSDNTQLIETLYRTPQMNVNKTLYDIESQVAEDHLIFDSHDDVDDCYSVSSKYNDCTDILKNGTSPHDIIDDKKNMLENLSPDSNKINQNLSQNNESTLNLVSTKGQDKYIFNSCGSSNNFITSNVQKENSNDSYSSSPEVSSTTSEEKSSSILLKITNCNGSRVSEINEIYSDTQSKLSYKLTEKHEYGNYSSSRTLITKAAQKYIPPLKETVYDLKVKLPLPQHRLQTLKQLKVAKLEPKIDASANNWHIRNLKQDISKKQKPKFEDVLKSIDEINFKKHKGKIKKVKSSIPKVVIKKNENGAHYASSKTTRREEIYNPDLTGRKWQPWVFLEKNNFIDRMALHNKFKAVYCHRKNNYVLAEKFRKYKSVYNANFVISDTSTKGDLKYTIRLKQT